MESPPNNDDGDYFILFWGPKMKKLMNESGFVGLTGCSKRKRK
jgi:hypothetical protein